MFELTVNDRKHRVDVDPETPLAWVLRDELGLKGTRHCCAVGACGACTVHVNGQATRSCILPVSAAQGSTITTIEGLSAGGLHPVQQAWIEQSVVQCGFCQSGFIMAAAALVDSRAHPSDADIDGHLTNLCRCGTYARVRRAVHRAAEIKALHKPSHKGAKV